MKRALLTIFPAILLLLFSSVAWSAQYHLLPAPRLKAMLANKNFFLIDVHVPVEPQHIPGTDAIIDFRRIRSNADKLPTDKNTPIVVYCLGGPMGDVAAETLIDMGYTHVYNLQGGMWAYEQL